MVNEKDESDEPSMTPHLWSYRPKITVEHLTHYLDQGNYKKQYPILHAFLKQVCNLLWVVCRPIRLYSRYIVSKCRKCNQFSVSIVSVQYHCMTAGIFSAQAFIED